MVTKPTQIRTLSGQIIDFADLSSMDPNEINVWDIIWPLSQQVRWTGQIPTMWDTLSHSVYCWFSGKKRRRAELTPHEELWLLLHDASEAYMSDVSRPLKQCVPDYAALQTVLEDIIFARFGVDMSQVDEALMHEIDSDAMAHESCVFRKTDDFSMPAVIAPLTKVKPMDVRDKLLELCTLVGTLSKAQLFAVPAILEPYVTPKETPETFTVGDSTPGATAEHIRI